MEQKKYFFAVDLGATSGRTILGSLSDGKFDLEEMTRFDNRLIETGNHFYWDIFALFYEIISGLKLVAQRGIHIESIGIDTWGCDFVYVDKNGDILRNPLAYRDPHTFGVMEKYFDEKISKEKVYEKTGIQFMNFNSLFGIGLEAYTVGSHDFYAGYCAKNNVMYTLDTGHYEPTENVSDAVSALLLFVPELMLHVSRPMHWDSDHVTLFDDNTRNLFSELVRANALDRAHIGLDYFDGSINRIGAYIIGVRAAQNLIKRVFQDLAIATLLYGDVLGTIMYPDVHDTWVVLELTHSVCNAAATLGVLNPELADSWVRI
jgi:hypothetical protein